MEQLMCKTKYKLNYKKLPLMVFWTQDHKQVSNLLDKQHMFL